MIKGYKKFIIIMILIFISFYSFKNKIGNDSNIVIVEKKDIDKIIALNKEMYIDKDNFEKIDLNIEPSNANKNDLIYQIEDESIAKITDDLNVLGVNYGKTKLKIMSKNNNDIFDEIDINVIEKELDDSINDVEFVTGIYNGMKYVYGTKPNTKLKVFMKKMDLDENVLLYDVNDNIVNNYNMYLATGMKLKRVINEKVFDEIQIAVKGDLDGNGIVSGPDSVRLQNYILNNIELSDIEFIASDLNGDNILNELDIKKINEYMLLKTNNLNPQK